MKNVYLKAAELIESDICSWSCHAVQVVAGELFKANRDSKYHRKYEKCFKPNDCLF